MRRLHQLSFCQVLDAAVQLRVPGATYVMQQHDFVIVRHSVRKERRGVDRPKGSNALCSRVQLAEAIHDALTVCRLAKGTSGVFHSHSCNTRIPDCRQRLSSWSAHRAQELGCNVARCSEHHRPTSQPNCTLWGVVVQHMDLALLVEGQLLELPVELHGAALAVDVCAQSIAKLLQALPEGSDSLAFHFWQAGVAGFFFLGPSLLEELEGPGYEGACFLLEHLHTTGCSFSRQRGGISGVDTANERIDETLECLFSQIPCDEILHRLLLLWHRVLDADGPQPGPDLAR
mmetsp:Transcript_48912/g.115029  ORF Transcript_48912/g.115029 Transcript_48912/m.115029 type:complete len:288 (-) Transcript_48912:596-1459(-)